MLTLEQDGAMAASLAELKAYLRIESAAEDDVLTDALRSAGILCEQFIGQWLIVRAARETVAGDGLWQRLTARPVVAIDAVAAVGSDGAESALPVDAYAIDIDAAGDGWVRAVGEAGGASGGRVLAVTYRAGLAAQADALPGALRQGIVRLAAEHVLARGTDGAAPPAIVSALWRPFRRMRLA